MRSRFLSFMYAARGLKSAWRSEPNLKIHFLATVIVIGLAIFFKVSLTEWAILIFCIGSVLVTELINTSIEALVDLSSPEIHPLAGKAKDIAAGSVLVAAIISAVVGGIIFVPKIWELCSS